MSELSQLIQINKNIEKQNEEITKCNKKCKAICSGRLKAKYLSFQRGNN